ncbi:hypothetical protein KCP78_02555 [Salmonella enterica subsp. enterica]|nr:hypothetical protein KCP78_02555 [Salmonella enterica subsp. enterica]
MAQSERVLQTAKALGILLKAMLSSRRAARSGRYQGLRGDHIEYLLSKRASRRQCDGGTVGGCCPALLLYFLRETQRPPVELPRRYRFPSPSPAISTGNLSPFL